MNTKQQVATIVVCLVVFTAVATALNNGHNRDRFRDDEYHQQCPPCVCIEGQGNYGHGYGNSRVPYRPHGNGYYGQGVGYGAQVGGAFANAVSGSYGAGAGVVAGGY